MSKYFVTWTDSNYYLVPIEAPSAEKALELFDNNAYLERDAVLVDTKRRQEVKAQEVSETSEEGLESDSVTPIDNQ